MLEEHIARKNTTWAIAIILFITIMAHKNTKEHSHNRSYEGTNISCVEKNSSRDKVIIIF